MSQRSIHWFRKGMRLHDNPALLKSFENASHVWPVFILDPWFVSNAHVGPNRWRFLMQTLKNLHEQLQTVNSRLFVVRGNPIDVLPKLFKKWDVTRLTFEVDTEPYSLERDSAVADLSNKHNVTIEQCVSHTLYDVNKTITKNGGKPPLTYQSLQKLLGKIGPPPKPVGCLTKDIVKDCKCVVDESVDKYSVPDLSELVKDGEQCGPCLFPGGETEALRRMEDMLKKENWICTFEKPKTEPNSLEPSTTVLSPYLKFGCLSARTFYYRLLEVYSQYKKHTQPPVSLHGQLLWREFFNTVGAGTPNFDKMEGNQICTQVDWDTNPKYLHAWKQGQTGYPFIDALMTQLKQEGWIHHLGRHAVACFLTRGDLWQHWEEGMKVFEEYLLDADWFLNAGNWMWLSASAFFHQYFRVYSPVAFGKKTDKNGDFIRKYIPKLAKFPAQYIYEPWTAPASVQQKAGCIIGKDYPKPIVDHSTAREANIKRMAAAYARKKGETTVDAKPRTGSVKRKADTESIASVTKKKKSIVSKNRKMKDFLK